MKEENNKGCPYMEELRLLEQEKPELNEDYDFFHGIISYTASFISIFGSDIFRITHLAQRLIAETYDDAPCSNVQKFVFRGVEFWIVSSLAKDALEYASSTFWGNIMVMLPDEY